MEPLYTFERRELERAEALKRKMASASRQRAYKERMAAEGYVQVTGWVHRHQQMEVLILMKHLQARSDLSVDLARQRDGRLVRIR